MPEHDDDIYKALADVHRRRIVSALCLEPRVAGDLGKLVGLAPNAVSFHLKVLQHAHLVVVRREGRFLRYHVNEPVLRDWQKRITGLFSGSPAYDALASTKPRPSGDDSPAPQPPDAVNESEDRLPTELL